METNETIFDSWLGSTSKMMNDWKRMAENLSGDQGKMWEGMGRFQQQWMDGYQSMFNNMAGTAANTFSHGTTRDAFLNMLKSTDVYTRLFQVWQPVFRQMQQNTFDPKDFWKMIDPAAFRSFVDNLFGLDQNNMMQAFVNQYGQLVNMWSNTVNSTGNSFGKMFSNGVPFANAMSQMNPQSMANWYNDMFQNAQRSFAPFFGQTTTGTMPQMEPVSVVMERWSNYINKLNQMQSLLYKTSMTAWEKVVQLIAERSKDGQTINNFDEFYNEWSKINESEFVALFNTDEYAALQGELLKLHTEITRNYERQMEALLQPYPLVFRSQLEEVYKTNHELRSRINELERMVAELQNLVQTGAANNNPGVKE